MGANSRPLSGALAILVRRKNAVKSSSSARIFGPDGLPGLADKEIRSARPATAVESLQAVHLRGETHITVRELRAALVYILFGVHFCEDYHGELDVPAIPYWDRAFSPNSPGRQGEVLRQLAALTQLSKPIPRLTVTYLVSPCQTRQDGPSLRTPLFGVSALPRLLGVD